jgi:hypothetical protein
VLQIRQALNEHRAAALTELKERPLSFNEAETFRT